MVHQDDIEASIKLLTQACIALDTYDWKL